MLKIVVSLLLFGVHLRAEGKYCSTTIKNGQMTSKGDCGNLAENPTIQNLDAKLARGQMDSIYPTKAAKAASRSALTNGQMDSIYPTKAAKAAKAASRSALTNDQARTSSPSVMTPSPTKAGPDTFNGSCIITFNGSCFWAHVESGHYVNFKRAEEICSNKGSVPAHFPNEEVYNSVIQYLLPSIPSERTRIDVWTGITIDGKTRQLDPPSEGSYMIWFPGRPISGSFYETFTHVLILVEKDPSKHGRVWDSDPVNMVQGVVCQTKML